MTEKTLNILIADDEEVIRLFVARILEDMGHTYSFAVDGQDCLSKLSDGAHYDLVFLDLVMPRMDGEQTLRKIRESYPDLPVVMESVQDDEDAIRELLQEGATAYLTKPVTPDGIRDVVTKIGEMLGDKGV